MPLLLDPGARPVVAHRGNSAHAPENSIEALREGLALGADALEFDVRLTRDGHAVLMHDPTVDRTTDGRGAVAELTLSDLRRLDAGFRFTRDGGRTHPWRGRGVRVPTLDDVLAAFPSAPFILELKSGDASLETRRLLVRHDAAPRCLVGSYSTEALQPFRGSAFARGASRREVLSLYARALMPGAPSRLPYQALIIPPVSRGLPLPVRRFSSMTKPRGVPTHVWTVDDPARARHFWDDGVNAIISNDPAVILAAAGRARGVPRPVPVS